MILLLGMNGYSESQAMPGLILYLVLGLGSVLGFGLASAFMVKHLMERRSFRGIAALTATVFSFSVLGVLLVVISFFGAIVFAEVVRGMK